MKKVWETIRDFLSLLGLVAILVLLLRMKCEKGPTSFLPKPIVIYDTVKLQREVKRIFQKEIQPIIQIVDTIREVDTIVKRDTLFVIYEANWDPGKKELTIIGAGKDVKMQVYRFSSPFSYFSIHTLHQEGEVLVRKSPAVVFSPYLGAGVSYATDRILPSFEGGGSLFFGPIELRGGIRVEESPSVFIQVYKRWW